MRDGVKKSAFEPVIGIDIGGTKSLAILRTDDGGSIRRERPTPVGAESLIETIVGLVHDVESEIGRSRATSIPPLAVGVGLPGLVTRQGVLRAAPNLVDVVELDAGRILEEHLGRRIWLDNDATCAAVAEWLEGSGEGCSDLLLVTIGTGIGAGIVSNGRLVRGANGFAGEIGHMFVDPNGPECPCGRTGCWERYASGSGLAFLARRAAANGNAPELIARAGSIEAIRGEHVADGAASGDRHAEAILDEFSKWVAVGLANMTNILDPKRIVLGGGAARMGDQLLAPVRTWLERLLYASDHRPAPEVVIARFAETAGAIGASLLPRVQ